MPRGVRAPSQIYPSLKVCSAAPLLPKKRTRPNQATAPLKMMLAPVPMYTKTDEAPATGILNGAAINAPVVSSMAAASG